MISGEMTSVQVEVEVEEDIREKDDSKTPPPEVLEGKN